MDDTARQLRERTGLDVIGCYAFGSGPAHADELLGFVTRGTKRATAGALTELTDSDDPFPAVGQLWGLLDGAGEPLYVAETVEVVPGRLDEVTPAFAWDEGEDDHTLESWREGHRRWGEQLGVDDPERLEVIFERFRIVWPVADRVDWLVEGVRVASFDEHRWLHRAYLDRHGDAEVEAEGERWPVAALPALVYERGGERSGALVFRPRPDGAAVVFAIEIFEGDDDIVADLRRGLAELARRHRWNRIVGVADTAGPTSTDASE